MEIPALTELRPGSTLGRYELLLPIAKGGMAQVWAAQLLGTRGFQKLVAIKTILAGVIDNTRMEQMFLEEAQVASQIHHPNVVGTLDLGEHEGVLYLVMEWVDGEPLSVVMSKAAASGGVPLPIAISLIGQTCKGLHAAHDLRDESGALIGLVHRDVSPQNLLVTFSGTAKLVDFGIAKATAKVSGLTEAGEIKGKFAYMAPEQVRGLAIDQRTDLFALGILLYLMTTGKHPFRGDHPAATLQNICSDQPPPAPRSFLPDYPVLLEAVVMKALAKDPAARFSTANEMLTALEEVMPGPLEASFDLQVAQYLKTLFGARASERRTAIRVAQEHAERQRTESSSAISLGTLRAIAIDQRESGSLSIRSTPQFSTPERRTPTPLPAPRPSFRGLTAALGALALLAIGGGIWGFSDRHGEGSRAASSSPVPIDSLDRAPHLVASAAIAPVEVPPAESAQEATDRSDDKHARGHKPSRLTRPVTPTASVVPPAALPTVSSAPVIAAAPAAASPAPPAASAASSTNAWVRGAFGGRH